MLAVSDTASKDHSKDASGPLIRQLLLDAGFTVSQADILPDEQQAVRIWVENADKAGSNLIVCSGGTGLGQRDFTPEAVSPLIVRPTPGLVQLMIESSLKVTPLAALSRPVAGLTKDNTLIITLPGSPKAARENLQAVLPVLSHALDLATGGSGQQAHKILAAGGTGLEGAKSDQSKFMKHENHHHHHQHHHHHPPSHEGDHAPKQRTVLSHDPSQGRELSDVDK